MQTYCQDGFGIVAGEVDVKDQGVLVAEACVKIHQRFLVEAGRARNTHMQ